MAKHIYKGNGAPTFIPREAGHHYVDLANGNQYLSVGTTTAGDWRLVTYGQYTDEQAQDAVGNILTDSSTINFDYDDPSNIISASVIAGGVDHDSLANYVPNKHIDHSSVSINTGAGLSGGGDLTSTRTISLTNTGVTASSYGSATQVATYSVDSQGRLTASSSVSIAISSSQVTDFVEAAQDAVGGILVDSSTIDFTYNDITNQISATVIFAGIDHNQLNNFVANKHIDHSTVSISAGNGLTGGGDLTATRTISMPNVGTAGTYGSATEYPVITTDAQGRVTTVTTIATRPDPYSIQATAAASSTSATWATIASMTNTPVAGKYVVSFSCNASINTDSNGDIALYIGGTQVAVTLRTISCNVSGAGVGIGISTLHFKTLINVNGSQVVDVRFRENGGGTLTIEERELVFEGY